MKETLMLTCRYFMHEAIRSASIGVHIVTCTNAQYIYIV